MPNDATTIQVLADDVTLRWDRTTIVATGGTGPRGEKGSAADAWPLDADVSAGGFSITDVVLPDYDAADQALQDAIDTEESARTSADSALDGRLDTLEAVSGATDAELAAAVAAHEADTTNVHGIADTSLLETTAGAQSKADAAQAAAVSAAATDATTKVAAEATARAAAVTALVNGAPAGGDTLGELDARIAVVEALGSLATDAELVAAVAALIGSADTAGDTLGELQSLIGLRLLKSANLSDLANAGTARTNLGLGTAAVVNTGTGAANVPTITQADARYAAIGGPIGTSGTGRFRPEIASTSAGPPLSPVVGAVNDTTIMGGSLWVCVTAGTPGTWVDVSKTEVADKSDNTVSEAYTSTVTAKLIPGMTHTEALLTRPHQVIHRYLARHSVAVGGFWIQTFLGGVAVDATFHIGSGGTANTADTYTTTHRISPSGAGPHTVEAKILLVTAGTVQTNPGGGQPCHMTIIRA